ncbi:GntR family transcriptional regulator [Aliikangiella sp. G2MR2-5]|uniref:GntR family transcriptional regulator n=1 Tax=Aliikangiella sp. G2MR2-5 TaxID=2788943 RepID=UPI0018AADDC0|nr:GntR family transcriptional regulator [Aliikangiella sp. G2MR2-5]
MSSKVTDKIKEDLTHQLTTYKNLPFKLTLGAIADYYNVSLTPVRQVVEELIEEDVLIRKPNGRLERVVEPSGDAEGEKVAKFQKPVKLHSDLDEQVTNYVVQLSLQNHEEYLREEATAKKYNTGRTIMRQVFSRLAGAGLIEHVPRCGWKVRTFREKDMLDYLEIREILEVKAMELARPYFMQDELHMFLKGNIASDDPALAELDNDLHNYWISRCDNLYIQDFFTRHAAFYTALFDYAALGEKVKTEMAQEHIDILEALIAEDYKAAERALVKHIRDQKKNVMRLVQFKKRQNLYSNR